MSEMFNDALDIIRQDGDYEERIEKDMQRECILCHLIISKTILENHFRQNHSSHIKKLNTSKWMMSFSLGSLFQRDSWLYQIMEYNSVLYVLSFKYIHDNDMIMMSVHAIITDGYVMKKFVKITLFKNGSSGSFVWAGPVEELPRTMPSHNEINCFKIKLYQMNLLSNSVKVINRKLLFMHPTVGNIEIPDLQNLTIILTAQLLDIV